MGWATPGSTQNAVAKPKARKKKAKAKKTAKKTLRQPAAPAAPGAVAAAPAPAPAPTPVVQAPPAAAPVAAPTAPAIDEEPAPAPVNVPLSAALGILAGAAVAFAVYKLRSKPAETAPAIPPATVIPVSPQPSSAAASAAFIPPIAAAPPLVQPRSGHTVGAAGPNGGKLIGGSYELRREIGAGGMGVVYEGFDVALDRKVALKKMRPEIQKSGRGRVRFLAEARTVAQMSHPNIVTIHSILEDAGDLYLVFEYVEGESLDQLLDREPRLTPARAIPLFNDVAEAVDYAHTQRVIHRDLKPSNIMIDRFGRSKVMDFGIAHQARITVSQLTKAEASGTEAYMPPEQEMGQAVRESDIYAFAAVVYESLLGELPFPGPNFYIQKREGAFTPPSKVHAAMTPHVDEVFARALSPEPKNRYPTSSQFLRTLQGALAGS